MRPLNTSPSEIPFSGILHSFVESLTDKPRKKGHLVGQVITVFQNKSAAIVALDDKNDIHLLISTAPKDDARLASLSLRGLKFENHELSIAGYQTQNYLDISCTAGKLPSFKRPFLRFAEDVLFEISKTGSIPTDAAYKTGVRWRRFWTANVSEITTEWLHGIFGELLFLKEMIDKSGMQVIKYWTGPLGNDHDFQISTELAVEIKTSIEMPFQIHCNIRQLDPAIFKSLYLACYQVKSTEEGNTLPDIVMQIEKLIEVNENSLDMFYERLAAAGYRRELESAYREIILDASKAAVFRIDDSFPKITEKSFHKSPDHRISNIRYSLKITGIKQLKLKTIIDELNSLNNYNLLI